MLAVAVLFVNGGGAAAMRSLSDPEGESSCESSSRRDSERGFFRWDGRAGLGSPAGRRFERGTVVVVSLVAEALAAAVLAAAVVLAAAAPATAEEASCGCEG